MRSRQSQVSSCHTHYARYLCSYSLLTVIAQWDTENRKYSRLLSYTPTHSCLDHDQEEGIVGSVQLKGLNIQASGRKMTKLETISASWVICDSWAGVAGTIALAISQGGPVTLIYGPILTLFLVGACALTLAELASVYPTAGGQYHWTSILAPKRVNRGMVSNFNHSS